MLSLLSLLLLFIVRVEIFLYILSSTVSFSKLDYFHNHPLIQSFDELSNSLGGTGRAKIFWDNLRVGKDPSISTQTDHNNQMECLSTRVRNHLMENILNNQPFLPLESLDETLSPCGTRKLLLRLHDGQSIESVLIPSVKYDRTTLCVSTQIGCDRGCKFCLTGTMGLIRNLTSTEIVAQVIRGIQVSRRESMPKMTNVVFMGMGDAARNIDQVEEAVKCLVDRKRMSMAQSKITVSTVGPSPEIFMRLAELPATLAWSLHSADDDIRKYLVPSTKHCVEDLKNGLLKGLHTRPLRGRTIMIAITLIDGINDTLEDAKKLADFVRPMLAVSPKIALDLIPYNDISVPGFSRPSTQRINEFQNFLRKEGYFCSVRLTRGDEESSACGMLVTKRIKSSKQASTTIL